MLAIASVISAVGRLRRHVQGSTYQMAGCSDSQAVTIRLIAQYLGEIRPGSPGFN